jgi:predicted transposase YbfD/YdcC
MPPLPLTAVFADLPDPRRETQNKLHLLSDILVVATCAVIGGAESWDGIAVFGRAKESFFRRFLPLENGIPSPDTFERVFAKLDPGAFTTAFGRWLTAALETTGRVPIAIDGKSVRGSKKATSTGCLHLVSAWATEARLTLGQVSVPDGSNEVAVIPELLAALELKGAVVTLDAAGCQKAIARQIRDQGGDYVLAVKGNPPALHEAVERAFAAACEADFEGVAHDGHASDEVGHGRAEERYAVMISDPTGLPPEWPDVAAVVQVNRERAVGDRTTTTTHYYVTSHRGTAAEMAGLIRGHWGIESMHWVLDVVYGEDDNRTRSGHAGANLAMIRKVAVSLTRRAPGKQSGVTKRLKAGWDDDYMLQVLQGIPAVVVR